MSPSGDRAPVRVLLALTGAPFEEALLAVLARPGSALTVARRCLDVVDLLAAAGAAACSYAVVWPGLHRLDREVVTQLAVSGVTLLGVAAGADADRLLGLGVAAVVAPPHADSAPSASGARDAKALAAELRALVHGGAAGAPDAVAGPTSGRHGYAAPPGPWGHPGGSPGGRPPPTTGSAVDPAPAEGRLVAVWGPVGAPGRTSVALGVADELVRDGAGVLLADADTYGPSLAQRLGVLDESSGLAAAVRAAVDGPPEPAAVAAAARALPGGLRVLTGLTRADRWPELRPAALAAVWPVARRIADVVVVDCGFCLEDDEELAYDTVAPRRNAAALVTVEAADVVVAVGGGDAIGVQRLVRGLDELRARHPGATVRVVVNRVRAAAVGRDPGRRIEQVLERYAGVTDVTLVPDDAASFDSALSSGALLADAAPRSPARVALRGLARSLAATTG